ncbi:O-antigen ligase family protein [Cohnella sp. 56]|uniref:O-antigen ligase family protein n=1 Tax=Cohnella sp. 56 TaxID=3113722 RepID=UPI0030E797FE
MGTIQNYIKTSKKQNNDIIYFPLSIHLFIHTFLYILLAIVSLNNSVIATSIISLIIIIYFLVSKPNEHFYFILGFVPFENLARVGEVNVFFLFLLISLGKLIISNKEAKYNVIGIIGFMYLVGIEVFNEINNISMGELINVLIIILYFFFFIALSNVKFYDVSRMIQNYIASYLVVIVQVIVSYGSLNNFMMLVASESEITRFGEEATNLGGAMGLPIYSAIVVSMVTSYYVLNSCLKPFIRGLIILIGLTASLIGILTISRSFLMMMIAYLLIIVLSGSGFYKKKIIKVLSLIFAISLVMYFMYSDIINNLITKFLIRVNYDSGVGIRGEIWGSCFVYLKEHPIGYIFGYGIRSYVNIGLINNLEFKALAHNLYLDSIMSIGLVGVACIFYLLSIFRAKLKNTFNTPVKLISSMPLIVFLVFGFSGLSLNYLKTWIYVLAFIAFTYALPKKQ